MNKTFEKLLALPLVLGVLLALASPAHAIGVYSSALAPGDSLGHPAQSWPGQPTFSVFTYLESMTRAEAMNSAGFYQDSPAEQTMASEFSYGGGSGFSGVVNSEVWQYRGDNGEGDGHLLFCFQVVNTSTEAYPGQNGFHAVSIFGGHWGSHEITDAGIIRSGSADEFVEGDLFAMYRPGADVQLGQLVRPWPVDFVTPGQASTWFYFETDSLHFGLGQAEVNGNTVSVSAIPTFAPAPEPVTVIALLSGVIGLGGYIRKRRTGLAR